MTGIIEATRPLADLAHVSMAQHVIRVHCAIEWPDGLRCLNCHQPYPCQANPWATSQLHASGWTTDQIEALDIRTGPWS